MTWITLAPVPAELEKWLLPPDLPFNVKVGSEEFTAWLETATQLPKDMDAVSKQLIKDWREWPGGTKWAPRANHAGPFSPPYTGDRVRYNEHRRRALARERQQGVGDSAPASVPDLSYEVYRARFRQDPDNFLLDQVNGTDCPLKIGIEEGKLCANFVNAIMDEVEERIAKKRRGDMWVEPVLAGPNE